jgi:hypothetical protein
MSQLLVDLNQFDKRFRELIGTKYDLGAKSPFLGAPESQIKYLDCSGFERDEIYCSTGVVIPDGSWNQREWCEKNLE